MVIEGPFKVLYETTLQAMILILLEMTLMPKCQDTGTIRSIMTENNTPSTQETTYPPNGFLPDNEDLNADNTLSELEE